MVRKIYKGKLPLITMENEEQLLKEYKKEYDSIAKEPVMNVWKGLTLETKECILKDIRENAK